ncbi:endonuclease/exonuclease/phosphatase_family protein [Hexamita inflata]|uniref:Endonuclease/exonuclease/phosphatase family protein n=1 Tax=Hexamita inflata TaxID=28002 RepID=A0AA86N960_9EUKA|nr:endonuclease/exonuclease/phosphatase family protein [Hexamita inflata]
MSSVSKLIQQNQDQYNSLHEKIAKIKKSITENDEIIKKEAQSFSTNADPRPTLRSSNVDVYRRSRYSVTSNSDYSKITEASDQFEIDVTVDQSLFHHSNCKDEDLPRRIQRKIPIVKTTSNTLVEQSSAQQNFHQRMPIKDKFSFMTFNILYGSCRTSSQHFWENRRSAVVQIIQSYSPDIVGVQEAVYWQLDYIREHLHLYSQYGSSRNGYYNEKADEFCAVLYKKDKFRVIQGETFFLSETPELVSKSWGSVFNRIATAVKFEILASGKQFWFFSTQLDFSSDEAVRCNQTQVLLERMQKLNAEGLPVVLSGDFHSPSFGPAHQKLTQEGRLRDAASKAREVGKISGCSIHHFDQQMHQDQEDFDKFENRSHYDWIFADPKTDVLSFEVCTDTFDGVQPSVHYPIVAEVKFQ